MRVPTMHLVRRWQVPATRSCRAARARGHCQTSAGRITAIIIGLVLANMLRTELLPLLECIAARTKPGGAAIFSGLLEHERADMERALTSSGFHIDAVRTETDATGDRWLALLTRREPPGATRRGDS